MKTENELIAEFMAAKKQYNDSQRAEYLLINAPKGFAGNWYEAGNLRYHESWDWLMPVVEKIEEVALNVVIETACVRIDCFDDAYPEYHSVTTFERQDDTKLKVLYRAIVAYIRWYNSQNS